MIDFEFILCIISYERSTLILFIFIETIKYVQASLYSVRSLIWAAWIYGNEKLN